MKQFMVWTVLVAITVLIHPTKGKLAVCDSGAGQAACVSKATADGYLMQSPNALTPDPMFASRDCPWPQSSYDVTCRSNVDGATSGK